MKQDSDKAIIAHQKAVAASVLERLKTLDKNAILAGGAPGDWRRGILARDLDFYIQCEPLGFVEQKLEQLGFEVESAFDNSSQNRRIFTTKAYTWNPNIDGVKNSTIDGVECQFIFVTVPVVDLIPKFAMNTSQIWWDGKDSWVTHDYRMFMKYGAVYPTGEVYSRQQEFMQKTRMKFKDYKFFASKEEFAVYAIDLDNHGALKIW